MIAKYSSDCRVVLQPRDIGLLRTLFECRVMTSAQVANLHFDGKREMAKKRLQKLKSVELIKERLGRVSEPRILFLADKGFKLLEERGVLTEYPAFDFGTVKNRSHVSPLTLNHEIEVMDVKVAFHSAACKQGGVFVEEFSTWPRLYQFESPHVNVGREQLVKPDGFIRLRQEVSPCEIYSDVFFLEVDRSSMVLDLLVNRAVSYAAYYSSGRFAERMGGSVLNPKEFPFRVLMIFKSEERRNNIAERLLQLTPPVLTRCWLTTLEEVKTKPFGQIWIRPHEYLEATKGTRFDPQLQRKAWAYRRQIEREELVQLKVRRLGLLDEVS